MKNTGLMLLLFCIFLFQSCKRCFEPIDYGKEACAHCKMTIVDKRYAAEMVDEKCKVFKFDDIACMKQYLQEHNLKVSDYMFLVANYNEPGGDFLDAQKAVILHSVFFKTPMNGQCGAFISEKDALSLKDSLNAEIVSWEKLQ